MQWKPAFVVAGHNTQAAGSFWLKQQGSLTCFFSRLENNIFWIPTKQNNIYGWAGGLWFPTSSSRPCRGGVQVWIFMTRDALFLRAVTGLRCKGRALEQARTCYKMPGGKWKSLSPRCRVSSSVFKAGQRDKFLLKSNLHYSYTIVL